MKLFDEIPYLENQDVVIKEMEMSDAEALEKLTATEEVYKFLPTFLFELKYDDKSEVISHIREECFEPKNSILMGIYLKPENKFCGIAEVYHYNQDVYTATIGYRLSKEVWGKGIATEVVALMVEYLFDKTDVEIVTAGTIVENVASEKVLEKNGFVKVLSEVEEDWGFKEKMIVNKWCLPRSE